ncbi:lipoprotein [Spiroplasma citri]|uniref:lipoprotein n=1 Tax=Spiroplasma citri TaxID=2133 RepID=UPI0013A0A606|nr:lipoprotein [Spiroplasma citri]QIA70797.1 lipoprotein [Spiroplasma citri]QIA70883.1 lipoprotein [Spiroplasma citri]QIA71898.1 lipoprotein [Spiroplasma citri]QIA72858.1 lipoprotein [Spiroplasma citri]
MKKILSLLGTFTLIGTTTASVVSCNKTQYSEDELKKLKEENKINTDNKQIKDNLEWISPQEEPFDTSDNKYYFVVWRSKLNSDWRIIKFKNDKEKSKEETVDVDNNYFLILHWWDAPKVHYWALTVSGLRHHAEHIWGENSGINYFKSVYRWNLDIQEPNLCINTDGNIKVK